MKFDQTGQGEWYVSEWQTVYMGYHTSKIRVPVCEINQDFQPQDIEVQFPEGARVDAPDGVIHLWGNGKPAKTFTSTEDYMRELYARARAYQGAPRQKPPPAAGNARNTVIIVNVVLLALLAGLFVWRRALSKRA